MTHSARFRSVIMASLVAIGGGTLLAHDMWIEPTAFRPPVGKSMGVRLRLGQDFVGEPLRRDPKLIDQFVVVDGTGTTPVVGRDGADPAGLLRVASPGLLVIGYHSKPSPVELTAQKFNQYLSEEGLDAIAALRSKAGASDADAREQFQRCAKSLVLAGAPAASQRDRVLGFPLELVAERNPYAMAAGRSLPLRLIYQNRPLTGALVIALNQDQPSARVSARSDAAGRVSLRLAQPGAWLVKAVHMIPAPAGSDHEWTSFWASLTFELPPSPLPPGATIPR